MDEEIGGAVLAIVGGIITVAIVSVIVGTKSKAPAAISAAGGALSQVISAAVNPVATSPGGAASGPATTQGQSFGGGILDFVQSVGGTAASYNLFG
jgi:hypothetical protein